jgi:hypothetical protein
LRGLRKVNPKEATASLARAPGAELIRQALLVIILLMKTLKGDAAEPVEISGNIESEYYNYKGVKVNSGSTGFKVITDGKGWQIITSQTGSAPYSIASDGKTTYTLITTPGPASSIGDAAQIDPISIPLATAAELIPWWFFILTKRVEARLPEIPLPWTDPRNDPQAYFCDRKINWSDSEPQLLDNAMFYFSESKVLGALRSPFLDLSSDPVVSRAELKKLAESASAAGKAGECSVTQWTNTSLGMYPVRFKVKVYNALVDHYVGRATLTLRILYTGVVNEIKKADSISYTPPLRGPIWTRDYRFRDSSKGIEAIRYGPSRAWLTNKMEVDRSGAEIIRRKRSQGVSSSISRYIVICILLVVSILPILLLKRRKRVGANEGR